MTTSKKNTSAMGKSKAEADFSELTVEEAHLLATGGPQDHQDYLVFLIDTFHEGLDNKKKFMAAGVLNKRYSFTACVLAIKNARDIEDSNVLPKLMYLAKSYDAVFAAEQSVDTESTVNAVKANKDALKLRAMLASKNETLFDMLIDGKITKENYERALCDSALAEAYIKEVYNGVHSS